MATPYLNLYRFTCPHCSRILKAPVQWAGRRGVCPNCQKSVDFPTTALGQANSWTAEQLGKVIAPIDALLDDNEMDRLAMLLAQGTCMEYRMATELLELRQPSARQWRRMLSLAEHRESLRLDLLAQLDRPALFEDDSLLDDATPSLALPPEAGALTLGARATQIVMRYLHQMRHGQCPNCQENPTGMACIYRDFDAFLGASKWNAARIAKWDRATRESLGLATISTTPPPRPATAERPA
jgi:hypothetical protein